MAPRRGARCVKSVNNVNYSRISLNDALCPICRCILVQPVTLPCNHDFCLPCFDGTLANANLTCPLCRVRFSSWHRIAKKDNKIINAKLWDVLQDKFPRQVRNRLQGVEENLEEETLIKLTTPGEIRKEYELQKRQQELELSKIKESDEKASAELIKKLKVQEDYEEMVREEKLRLDERVARQLAKEMGYESKPQTSAIIQIPKKRRPIEKFIKNMKATHSTKKPEEKTYVQDVPQLLRSIIKEKNSKQKNLTNLNLEVSDSNDSIENECRYFKPIDHRNIPPSKGGNSLIRVPAISDKPPAAVVSRPNGNVNFEHSPRHSAFAFFHPASSPIIGVPKPLEVQAATSSQGKKRKPSENKTPEKSKENPIRKKPHVQETPDVVAVNSCVKNLKSPSKHVPSQKKRPAVHNIQIEKNHSPPHKMILRDRKLSGSPFYGFDLAEMHPIVKLNGDIDDRQAKVNGLPADKIQQEKNDLEFAKKLQEQFNKERYSTRSSISCRNNIKKSRQVTLTEIISTSKCK